MLGFQAAPRLFSGQADEQFCLCSSEYKMSTCVIYCTNSHLFKGGGGGGGGVICAPTRRSREVREGLNSFV